MTTGTQMSGQFKWIVECYSGDRTHAKILCQGKQVSAKMQVLQAHRIAGHHNAALSSLPRMAEEEIAVMAEAMRPERITIIYAYEFLNEQSDTMGGQVQTTKPAREVFEQYRRFGLNPLWKIEDRPKPHNKAFVVFSGIEIDAFPNIAKACALIAKLPHLERK